jgi:teichuronic acid biosynthesis glycosyltransferase TuaC
MVLAQENYRITENTAFICWAVVSQRKWIKWVKMHLLVVALSFPSPENPFRGSFIGEQVRLLCERGEVMERITVLSPTTFVPAFMRRFRRVAAQALLPERYQMVEGCCEVLFPRYLKAPGELFLPWTTAQWCRIVDQTVARFAKTCPVSIIHANAGSVSSWASIKAARSHKIPCVVTYQGSEVHNILANRRKGWQLCRDSFKLADLNLFVSRSLETILRLHGTPSGRCEVLLRGVDQTRFFPSSQENPSRRVLFVGRVEKAKGAFDLLSAWVKVIRSFQNARLTMVGPDHTNGLFLHKVKELGLNASVTLTGPLPSNEVAELMRQSVLLCLPSHGEGTPNCVMEALSCGLPVVATRVGGIPDIVVHGRNGLLVDKEDREGLAAAIVTLLSDRGLSLCMGEVALAFARERLDARKTVSRLIELYGELIASRSGRVCA